MAIGWCYGTSSFIIRKEQEFQDSDAEYPTKFSAIKIGKKTIYPIKKNTSKCLFLFLLRPFEGLNKRDFR